MDLIFSCPGWAFKRGLLLRGSSMNSFAPHVALPQGTPADPCSPVTPYVKLSPATTGRGPLSTEVVNTQQIVRPPCLIPEQTWGSRQEHKLRNKFLKI